MFDSSVPRFEVFMSAYMNRKIRSFVKWHGGKSYHARNFIELMPPHKTYVEPFVGGGSVFLNKSSVITEVINDLNPRLMNAWEQIKFHPEDVIRRLSSLTYESPTFLAAKRRSESPDLLCGDLDDAANFIVVNRMSRGGMGGDFAWSDRLRGGQPGDVNAWETMIEEIPAISGALQGVEIRCGHASEVIDDYDSEDTLFYLDPPYLHETRTAKSVYAHEMTTEDHWALLAQILESRAIIMVSGYHSEMYDNALKDWTLHEFRVKNNSGQGKKKNDRIECLWINR
jgi:DNA adenine methylase